MATMNKYINALYQRMELDVSDSGHIKLPLRVVAINRQETH